MAFTKINAAGIGTTETVTVDGLTVINNGSFGGNLSVGGTLTYEDVTNVDSVGLITARNGIVVGSGITLSKDGDVFATGVTTTGSLVSSGAISGTTGTFTGDVDIADKIVHTGDTNTAIRFPAADTITAETGGSERARLGSSGEVYFGTSNWPTGSLGKAAGRVMMGNEGSLTIWNETNSAGGGGTLKLACKEGSDATRVGFVNLVGGTENTSDRSSFFKIQVSNSSGSGIERLRIKSDGNVEIGGGTHSRRLAVHDTTNSVILIEGASNGTSNLMFGDENDEDVGMLGYNHASNYLAFTVNAAERVRITSGGEVGINTTVVPYGNFSVDHGQYGLTRISGYSHILVQNKNASTTEFWNFAPRDDGSVSIGRGVPTSDTGIITDRKLIITSGGNLQFDSGFGSAETAYGVRAWVFIDNTSGSMTPYTNGSGGVSSVDDLGVGSARVNLSITMPNTVYAIVSGFRRSGTYDMVNVGFSNATTNFRFDSFNDGSGTADLNAYSFVIVR